MSAARLLSFLAASTLGLLILAAPLAAQPASETGCISCHTQLPAALGQPVDSWRGSIHQQQGISCHGCHGGDPTLQTMEAMSPELGFLGAPTTGAIPEFCGRCHVGVKEDYLASAHGQALGRGGPQCVSCHGSHAVRPATIELINPQDCSRCHDYGRAGELRAAMAQTEGMIVALEGNLERLRKRGILTREMEGEVFSLRNEFHRLLHSVDVDRVRQRTGEFQAALGEVNQQLEEIDHQLRQRKLVGALVVALLACATLLFVLLRRDYAQQEREEEN